MANCRRLWHVNIWQISKRFYGYFTSLKKNNELDLQTRIHHKPVVLILYRYY